MSMGLVEEEVLAQSLLLSVDYAGSVFPVSVVAEAVREREVG